MRIGVDFDRVLFDTDSFNDYLKENVEGLRHVDARPFNEHGVYSPRIHAEMCGIDPESVYEVLKDLDRFILVDTSVMDESDHEFLIVTRGEVRFQSGKIEATSISEKVDDIIVVEKGSKDVGEIDFLIDDQKREIEEAGIPGFEFDAEKNTLEEAVKEAERHEA